jgi:spoIIIJ-associated protein
MTGFFGKLFGGGKKKEASEGGAVGLVKDIMAGLVERGGFDLTFKVWAEPEGDVKVEMSGEDVELLKTREGQLLDAFQLFVTRVLQHQLPEQSIEVSVDCEGYREEANQALIDLADKLKEVALSKGKSVYIRALPPKDRKVVHQYLAEDGRVKSRSIGDGHFKKIKIYPAKDNHRDQEPMADSVM